MKLQKNKIPGLLKIKWPIKKPILSKKDKQGLSFIQIKKEI